MDLFFLLADRPITKRLELTAKNEIKKTSYPLIADFTSKEYPNSNLHDLYNLLTIHAEAGDVLLKGVLTRPLVRESRAGSTDRDTPTDWICLDLDGVTGYTTVDDFLKSISCHDVSYILQWSSSMGVGEATGLRCHIFMELERETSPALLKQWLIGLNLNTQTLANQLDLTKTYNALTWPLDITTCQNDKLLFIADPELVNLPDPLAGEPRIQLHERRHSTLSLPQHVLPKEALRTITEAKIAELRAKYHLPKRKKIKYSYTAGVEVMDKPDAVTITGMKQERGYVYFNFNGGDSWGYYHPEEDPRFIHNFKGEPVYRTEELLPDYWSELQHKADACTPDKAGMVYLAFREFRTGNYYNGIYDTATGELNLAMAKNTTQLDHFMKQNGQPSQKTITDWELTFDPHDEQIVDAEKKKVNIYKPSVYMNKRTTLPPCTSLPPVCKKVIHHVLGGDLETVDHFINWLACIVQYKTCTGTAWVLQGTQGTGKGVLFHQIIAPMMGEQNVVAKRMEELESEFTGYMENKFVVFIDEMEKGGSLYHSKVTAKLKNLIVEPYISVRKMYTPAYMAPNFANMIFASNKTDPVEVMPDDRRFNVGAYQKQKIQITTEEIEEIGNEIPFLTSYLLNYQCSATRGRTPLVNEARTALIDISRSSIDVTADALVRGDFVALWELLPDKKPVLGITPMAANYEQFRALLIDLLTTPRSAISRDELFIIFDWCVGNMPKSPGKLTALLKHHELIIVPTWCQGRAVRGVNISWVIDETWRIERLREIAEGLI